MEKRIAVLSLVFASALAGVANAAQIEKVIVHQQWPWTTDVKVEYKISGVTAPVDVNLRAWRDGEEIDAALLKNASSGDIAGVSKSGIGTILIDPVRIFGAENVSCGLRVELSLTDSPANIHEVIYRVYDLDDGSCTDLTRADILSRKYGDYVTDFSSLGEGFNTSVSDVLIWTGVTNDVRYATDKLVLRKIPAASAGVWTMGSATNERWRARCYGERSVGGKHVWTVTAATETQHPVTLTNDYFIGVFELTQAQYAKVVHGHTDGSYITTDWPSYFSNATDRATRPVEQVPHHYLRGLLSNANWPTVGHETVESWSFLALLRARLSGAPLIDLPTEAQWEFACRAGTTSQLNSGLDLLHDNWEGDANLAMLGRAKRSGGWIGGEKIPTGDVAADVGGTAKVGSYLPNAYGLYDMHGNVFEWCLDYFVDFTEEAATEPPGPTRPNDNFWDRAFRGGNWYEQCGWSRSASRVGANYALSVREGYGKYIGARLCLTVPGGAQ